MENSEIKAPATLLDNLHGKAEQLKQYLAKFNEGGACIALRVGFWRGRITLKANDLGLKKDDINDGLVQLGRKYLVSPDSLRPMQRIEARARLAVTRYSCYCPLNNSYFVAKSNIGRLEAVLMECREEFYGALDTFCERFDAEIEAVKKLHPEWFKVDDVDIKIPTLDEIRATFMFSWLWSPLSSTSDFEMLVKNQTEQAIAAKEAHKHKVDCQTRYNQHLTWYEEGLKEFFRGAVIEGRNRMMESLQTVTKKLKQGETIAEGSLTTLMNAITFFEESDFMDDTVMKSKLANLKRQIEARPDYNNTDSGKTRKALAAAINEVFAVGADVVTVNEVVQGHYRRLSV